MSNAPFATQQAAAEIVALINSRSQSPWPHEIEAIIAKAIAPDRQPSTLLPKVREAVARLNEGFQFLGPQHPGSEEEDAAEAEVSRRQAALEELEKQVPNPPHSYGDLVALAEIARAGAEVRCDGRMAELDQRDVFQRPAARLVEAVLQFAGRDMPSHCQPSAALSADHLRYREVVAEIARFDGSDYPPGMSEEESEPALTALSNEAMTIERKVWATPARTLADVLLRGEMALYNENGIMDELDDPEAYYDERSAAQLIKAVVDVLGGLHAS